MAQTTTARVMGAQGRTRGVAGARGARTGHVVYREVRRAGRERNNPSLHWTQPPLAYRNDRHCSARARQGGSTGRIGKIFSLDVNLLRTKGYRLLVSLRGATARHVQLLLQ